LRFTWETAQKYLVNSFLYGGSSILLVVVLFYLFRTYVLYKISVEGFPNVTNGDKGLHLIEFIPMVSVLWVKKYFSKLKNGLGLRNNPRRSLMCAQ
jgi:hypothetical protein